MTEGKMSTKETIEHIREAVVDFWGEQSTETEYLDKIIATRPTNPYERAVIEQAMVTECVNIEGRDPTDIIRDIISWHVDMDRGARNAEQPKAATDAQVDDLAAALNQCADDLLDEDGPSSFSIAEQLYELAAFHPAPSRAVGAFTGIDIGEECLRKISHQMDRLGISTPVSIEEFGATLESQLRAMCRALDGLWDAINATAGDGVTETVGPAQPKLIGWRMADYTAETSDPDMAKNWSASVPILPIFEGDPNTKLDASPSAPRVGVTEGEGVDEAIFIMDGVTVQIHGDRDSLDRVMGRIYETSDRIGNYVAPRKVGVPMEKTESDYEQVERFNGPDPYSMGHMDGWNACRDVLMLAAAPEVPK